MMEDLPKEEWEELQAAQGQAWRSMRDVEKKQNTHKFEIFQPIKKEI